MPYVPVVRVPELNAGLTIDNTVMPDASYRQRTEVYSGETLPVSGPVTNTELRASAVATRTYDSQIGKLQRVLPLGGLLVDSPTRLCGTSFMGSLANGTSDYFWVTARGSAATSVLTDNNVTLTGGTTNSDWCSIATSRNARFLFACPNLFRSFLRFSSVAAANTSTYIGAITMTNGAPQAGYCFKVDGAGVVSCQSYTAGTPVLNAATGFNGELGTTYSVPDVNFHAWEIVYFAAKVWFFIDGQLLHSAAPTTALLSLYLTVPIGVSVVNGTSPTSRIVTTTHASIVRYGKEEHSPRGIYIAANVTAQVLKTGAGKIHTLVFGSPSIGTITLYDALSATNTILLMTFAATDAPQSIDLNLDFYTGLTITTSANIKDTTIIVE